MPPTNEGIDYVPKPTPPKAGQLKSCTVRALPQCDRQTRLQQRVHAADAAIAGLTWFDLVRIGADDALRECLTVSLPSLAPDYRLSWKQRADLPELEGTRGESMSRCTWWKSILDVTDQICIQPQNSD